MPSRWSSTTSTPISGRPSARVPSCLVPRRTSRGGCAATPPSTPTGTSGSSPHRWARHRRPALGVRTVADTAAPGTGVQVQLSVRRGRDAVAFYIEAFGARVLFRLDSGGGNDGDMVAQLAVGGTQFWVEDESPKHHNFSPETVGGATARLLHVVDDPGAVIARAVAA